MTREEVVNSMSLQDAIQVLKDTNCYGTMDIAKTVILKALEQKLYADVSSFCISRQAVLEIIKKCHCEEWVKADIGAPIEALQPVTPAEKVGQWEVDKSIQNSFGYDAYVCSVCETIWNSSKIKNMHYCPTCGAKMQEVEE